MWLNFIGEYHPAGGSQAWCHCGLASGGAGVVDWEDWRALHGNVASQQGRGGGDLPPRAEGLGQEDPQENHERGDGGKGGGAAASHGGGRGKSGVNVFVCCVKKIPLK